MPVFQRLAHRDAELCPWWYPGGVGPDGKCHSDVPACPQYLKKMNWARIKVASPKPARPCALVVSLQEPQGGDGMSFPGCAGTTPSSPPPQHVTGWFPAEARGCLSFLGGILPPFLGSVPSSALHHPSAPPQSSC